MIQANHLCLQTKNWLHSKTISDICLRTLFLNFENYHKWCKTGRNWFISQLFVHLLKCPHFDVQMDDRSNLICIVQMLSRKLFLCTIVCQIFFWLPNHNIWTGLFYDWLRYVLVWAQNFSFTCFPTTCMHKYVDVKRRTHSFYILCSEKSEFIL